MGSTSPGDAFVAFEHVQKSYDGVTLVVRSADGTLVPTRVTNEDRKRNHDDDGDDDVDGLEKVF